MTTTETETPTRQHAFAQLGTDVSNLKTGQEVLESAGLANWDVRKRPLFTEENRKRLRIKGKMAVLRTNPETGDPEEIGTVSPKYQEVQNEELITFLDNIVDESGAHYDNAGFTRGGRRVFVSMLLPDHMKIGGIDKVQNRLVVTSSHDGSGSFQALVSPTRFFCMNQLPVMVRNAGDNVFRARHTKNVTAMVSQAREALDMTFAYLENFQTMADRLINTEMTAMEFDAIINAAFGAKEDAPAATVTRCDNKIAQMNDLFNTGEANDNIRGTAWAGFNALTEWYDHFSPVRGASDTRRAEKAAFDTAWKQNALELVSI
jgi:phage/plasmid-like protein (TIGR03299 family)